MPTPSSDIHAQERNHTFTSTCPDEQATTTPQSPSSWYPLPPPPYSGDSRHQAVQDPESPPRPTSRSDDGRSPDAESSDDAQKTSDVTDEDMTRTDTDEAAETVTTPTRSAVVGTQDGVIQPDPAQNRRNPVNISASDGGSPAASLEMSDEIEDAPDVSYGWEDGYLLEASQFPSLRVISTSPSSYLRSGSKFAGTQQSERQVYQVQVEIKHVDLRESFMCGYLRIQGLTEDHPTLTTYFEGEIIGTRYSFFTKHAAWGASDKTDLTHWLKFPPFRPLSKTAKKGGSPVIKDIAQQEHIFMRWKEHFLVPDHRVRTINGASFEGFYYICFNQIRGDITGIYFHSKSEKFQQLELKHVEDRGCHSALEFR